MDSMDYSYHESSRAPSRTGSASASWNNPPQQPLSFTGWPSLVQPMPVSMSPPVFVANPQHLSQYMHSPLDLNALGMPFQPGVFGLQSFDPNMHPLMFNQPTNQNMHPGYQMGHVQSPNTNASNSVPRRDQGIVYPAAPAPSQSQSFASTPAQAAANRQLAIATYNSAIRHQSGAAGTGTVFGRSVAYISQRTAMPPTGTTPIGVNAQQQQSSHLHPQHGPLSAPPPLGERRRIHHRRHSRTMIGPRTSTASDTSAEAQAAVSRLPPSPAQPTRRVQSLDAASGRSSTTSDQSQGPNLNRKALARCVIEVMERVVIDELDETDRSCVICYNDYNTESPEGIKEQPLRLPKCKHIFGSHCIQKWFEESDSCPYCRDRLLVRQVRTKGQPFMNMMRVRHWSGHGGTPGQMYRNVVIADANARMQHRRSAGTRRSAPDSSDEPSRRTRQRLSAAEGETMDLRLSLAGPSGLSSTMPMVQNTTTNVGGIQLSSPAPGSTTSTRQNGPRVASRNGVHSQSVSQPNNGNGQSSVAGRSTGNMTPTTIQGRTVGDGRAVNLVPQSFAGQGQMMQQRSQPNIGNSASRPASTIGTQTSGQPTQAPRSASSSSEVPRWSFGENWL